MKKDEICRVNIDKLTSLGLGFAKVDGFVVFVANSCPGDVLDVRIKKVNKNYARAEIVNIITPSQYRVQPFCPMQKVCGACNMQFIDYDYQLDIKRQVVQEELTRTGGLDILIPDVIKSPKIREYRRKIQYPVSQTKNSKRIIAGYYKSESHDLVNIKYCPIQPRICDEIIEFIKEAAPKYGVSGYVESVHSGDLRHIVIRNSTLGMELVTLVVTKETSGLKQLAQSVFNKFDSVKGVCININNKRTNVIMGAITKCVAGSEFIEEKFCDKTFLIGSETFFQVNVESAQNIFSYVKDYISSNYEKPSILDAYAGISAFGICLSDIANHVVTIEENSKSVELARRCIKLNNINNVEINGGDAGEFFERESEKFDIIIVDPPRKGCTKQSLDSSLKLCKDKIIYVSCNPSTLARDLKYLTEKGCKVETVQPFDMFCHTYHIENVAIISCPKMA